MSDSADEFAYHGVGTWTALRADDDALHYAHTLADVPASERDAAKQRVLDALLAML